MGQWRYRCIREMSIKFANSPPRACRSSSGHKPQHGLMTLTYQHFTAVLLLIYGDDFSIFIVRPRMIFTSTLDGGEWSCFTLRSPCSRGKNLRYPLIKRLGGPKSRSGRCREESCTNGNRTRAVQSVSLRYIDWDISAANTVIYYFLL
jgi:hypothetical protein